MMFIINKYVSGLMTVVVLLIGAAQGKDLSICRRPAITNCDTSESYIMGWKFTGWYFDTVMGSCRPLYTRNGWHICSENYPLPYSRIMCEELCADRCIMTNGAPGICMSNKICKMFNHKPPAYRSCGSNLNCCPKASDSELEPLTELENDVEGIVQIARLKNIRQPGYPPDAFSYVYYFPNLLTTDGRRYK